MNSLKDINQSPKLPPLGWIEGGFSRLNRQQRITALQNWFGTEIGKELDLYLHSNPSIQKIFSELSENYLTNYFLPLGVIPNVVVNNKLYMVPVVTEESSVIAAASRAAKFWAGHGGFKTELLGTTKKGQVHFLWTGESLFLYAIFSDLKTALLEQTKPITAAMQSRGGGITSIELVDQSNDIPDYYFLDVSFETADSMGANFINSCLEQMSVALSQFLEPFMAEGELEVIMSILSNYTPESAVRCSVECSVDELKLLSGSYSPSDFARRFQLAVQIANCNISRAVTHNKGIFNGVDAVLLATGNDWRAAEAAGHSYAAKDGRYKSLSEVEIKDGIFTYSMTIPLAIGVVGGLTNLHPLARFCLKLLGEPSSGELMQITAAVGMANNLSAISSLVTSGIQRGHMKMHLSNILNQLNASEQENQKVVDYFQNRTVSYSGVENYLKELRS